jgi:hypothetical protein
MLVLNNGEDMSRIMWVCACRKERIVGLEIIALVDGKGGIRGNGRFFEG